jgi:hypothetical protein
MSFQPSHYMIATFGHYQAPFSSQLCAPVHESNLHPVNQSHGIYFPMDIDNSLKVVPLTLEPSQPCIIQPEIQQDIPQRQPKLHSGRPLKLLAPAPTSANAAPFIASEQHRSQWEGSNIYSAIDVEVDLLPRIKTRSGRLAAKRNSNNKIPCPYCSNEYLRLSHLRRHMRSRKRNNPVLVIRKTHSYYRFRNQAILMSDLPPRVHQKRFT